VEKNELFEFAKHKGLELVSDDKVYQEYTYDSANEVNEVDKAVTVKAAKKLEMAVMKLHENRRAGKLSVMKDRSLKEFLMDLVNKTSVCLTLVIFARSWRRISNSLLTAE
jgi:hypothetical protein